MYEEVEVRNRHQCRSIGDKDARNVKSGIAVSEEMSKGDNEQGIERMKDPVRCAL